MVEIAPNQLPEIMKRSFVKENAAGVNTCIQINLSGAKGGKWWMLIKNQALDIQVGSTDEARAEIDISTDDFLGIISGTLDPLKAFFTGKVKIIGDQSAVIKLLTLFELNEHDLKHFRD